MTCGITLAIPTGHYYHYWAPFLLLIAGYVVAVGLLWGLLFLFALPYKKTNHYTKPSKWALFWLSDALHYIHKHARIKVKVINEEALPKEKFLLVCNPCVISGRPGFEFTLLSHSCYRTLGELFNFSVPVLSSVKCGQSVSCLVGWL